MLDFASSRSTLRVLEIVARKNDELRIQFANVSQGCRVHMRRVLHAREVPRSQVGGETKRNEAACISNVVRIRRVKELRTAL